VLRKIFEPNRDEVEGTWRNAYTEDLQNLYSLANIQWRRMRWARYVACIGIIMCTEVWLENQKGSQYSEDLGIARRRILTCVLSKQDWRQ
jgi:hypothetical protein